MVPEACVALKWDMPATTLEIRTIVKRRFLLPFLMLLVSPALPLIGQQAAGPVCVVFTVKDLSPGPDTKDYEQTITKAVSAAFGAANFRLITDSVWQDAASSRSVSLDTPISETSALEISRSLGASFAVTGVYSVENDEVYYSIQCWDVKSEKLAAGIQASTPFNLAFFSGLNMALSSNLLTRISTTAPKSATVVFTSPNEGMELKLSGDLDIGRVTGGRVTLPAEGLAAGTKVVVQKTLQGYHPAEQTVTLATAKDIPLKPLVKEYSKALELDSTVGQLLGLGAALRGYRVPDWFFVRVGGYLWLQPPANAALRTVLHTDMHAGIGGYLFLPPDAPVRLGLSTGAGLILSLFSTPGLPTYTEFYLNVVDWWLEATLFGVTLFVRQEFKYDLGIGTSLLGQGWMLGQFPPTTLGVLFRW
jgi:hypothetical protein